MQQTTDMCKQNVVSSACSDTLSSQEGHIGTAHMHQLLCLVLKPYSNSVLGAAVNAVK